MLGAIIGGLISAAVSIAGSIWQTNKAEKRAKENEAKAEKRSQMAGRRAVVKAMRQAAAGSTLLRINRAVLEGKREKLAEGNVEKNYYTLAARAGEKAKEDADTYGYGKIENN